MSWLRVLGKLLISIGVGVLLFVAWVLWGTGLYTSERQNELSQAFDSQAAIDPIPVTEDGFTFEGPPDSFQPVPGQGVFRLRIPKIDLNKIVVQGVGTEELRSGPGHYPDCREGFPKPLCTEFEEQWPGERGRVVVSGHRTTYGAPFWDLDKLTPGDEIITETKWGTFTYIVTERATVAPESRGIVVDGTKAEIVLTTCNPKFSAEQRLIVFAEIDMEVADL